MAIKFDLVLRFLQSICVYFAFGLHLDYEVCTFSYRRLDVNGTSIRMDYLFAYAQS